MLVAKSAYRARAALNIMKRGFGAASGHSDHHDDHHDNHDDHGHDDHGDHDHDDHHHHIEKADVNHTFI